MPTTLNQYAAGATPEYPVDIANPRCAFRLNWQVGEMLFPNFLNLLNLATAKKLRRRVAGRRSLGRCSPTYLFWDPHGLG